MEAKCDFGLDATDDLAGLAVTDGLAAMDGFGFLLALLTEGVGRLFTVKSIEGSSEEVGGGEVVKSLPFAVGSWESLSFAVGSWLLTAAGFGTAEVLIERGFATGFCLTFSSVVDFSRSMLADCFSDTIADWDDLSMSANTVVLDDSFKCPVGDCWTELAASVATLGDCWTELAVSVLDASGFNGTLSDRWAELTVSVIASVLDAGFNGTLSDRWAELTLSVIASVLDAGGFNGTLSDCWTESAVPVEAWVLDFGFRGVTGANLAGFVALLVPADGLRGGNGAGVVATELPASILLGFKGTFGACLVDAFLADFDTGGLGADLEGTVLLEARALGADVCLAGTDSASSNETEAVGFRGAGLGRVDLASFVLCAIFSFLDLSLSASESPALLASMY